MLEDLQNAAQVSVSDSRGHECRAACSESEEISSVGAE